MEEYGFGTFFAELCHKQGLNPITKKETCQEWIKSKLITLNTYCLQRLAKQAPELIEIEMYKLPTIKQLLDLHYSLENDDPQTKKKKCPICNNKYWIILINIDNGESLAARCECMIGIDNRNVFAKDLLNTGEYVTDNNFDKRNNLLPEEKERTEKFLKRLLHNKTIRNREE